ncbi:hypothetical protein BJY04DRAFT_133740 [Aspergillus karnatakaensis]|uniref:Zn(II)2Cys6 transcription factor n=1 Tax=Aspergillus karnatakaensis TaxID=1810916 RepID=UPI003CCDF899
MDPAQPKKRRRLRQPKSSTGCRTCRTRHVKCDETPGACRRCITSGFKCDGYDLERLPHRRNANQIARTALTEYHFRAILPSKTSEERRFFNYFHCFTVPMMSGWFDSRMWNSLILQMCESEPAICHAVVALSALQEVSETAGLPVLPEDMSNRTHRFALYQYNRSIEHLRLRMGSHDPNVRSTVLLCCLLFIAFELIRGKYMQAVTHLQSGLDILGMPKLDYHALYRTHPAFEQDLERSLAAAMIHLDLQVAHFGFSNVHRELDMPMLAAEQAFWPTKMSFDCVQDACFMRDRTFLQFCLFDGFCNRLSAAEIEANYTVLSKEQKKQQIQLLNFAQALDELEEKKLSHGNLTQKDRDSLQLLRMHHKGVSIIIDVCLIKSKEVIRDNFADRFLEVIDLGERITEGVQRRAREAGPQPTLMMETAVIGPLYYMIEKCRNPAVALRGVQVLESWPHREGMWDSVLAARMARDAMAEAVD